MKFLFDIKNKLIIKIYYDQWKLGWTLWLEKIIWKIIGIRFIIQYPNLAIWFDSLTKWIIIWITFWPKRPPFWPNNLTLMSNFGQFLSVIWPTADTDSLDLICHQIESSKPLFPKLNSMLYNLKWVSWSFFNSIAYDSE